MKQSVRLPLLYGGVGTDLGLLVCAEAAEMLLVQDYTKPRGSLAGRLALRWETVVEGVLWCGTGGGVITGQKIRVRSTSQSRRADRWKRSGVEPWTLSYRTVAAVLDLLNEIWEKWNILGELMCLYLLVNLHIRNVGSLVLIWESITA